MGRAALKASKRPAPAVGFRMPAEWEPHEATWIGWPHNRSDWPGRFGPIPWVYAEIARWILRGETLRVLVESRAHEESARRVLRRVGADSARIEFFRIPTDRGWTRDSGPAFVRRGAPRPEVAIRRFRFNGWARYPDWRKDDRVPERVARALDLRVFPAAASGREVVLEGGAIEVNGSGTLISTEECLLDPRVQVRNPGFSRADYERVFRDSLGAENVLWLGRGIAGDDTHGHVDDLCRFTGPRTVVLCREENASDENHAALEENRERLEGMRLEDGSRVEVVSLPMPDPVRFDGRRLPASYANFYVA
ncbi:MAG TPA: agmatine deiminase family protein, partial [Thermoanaerobaculia bacterium]|nr:agmatine deiminase family protein [Thermoanaerobaculia bacterium]